MGINIAVIAGVAICGVALQQKGVQKQFSKTIETFKEENENASMEMHTPTVTEEAVIEEQSNTTEAEEHIDQPEASEDEKILYQIRQKQWKTYIMEHSIIRYNRETRW